MRYRAFGLISVCCILWGLTSCVNQGEYYSYKQIERGLWSADSVYSFRFDSLPVNVADSNIIISYNSVIEIVHNNSYPYRNLQIIAGYHNAIDSLVHYDTLNCILEDSVSGSWLGSGTGGLFQLSVPFAENVVPVKADSALSLYFSVRHAMQDNPLKGIEKIGVRIKANLP